MTLANSLIIFISFLWTRLFFTAVTIKRGRHQHIRIHLLPLSMCNTVALNRIIHITVWSDELCIILPIASLRIHCVHVYLCWYIRLYCDFAYTYIVSYDLLGHYNLCTSFIIPVVYCKGVIYHANIISWCYYRIVMSDKQSTA